DARLLAKARAALLLQGGRNWIVVRGPRPRSRRVREDVELRQPSLANDAQRVREGALVLGRKADDHVRGEIEVLECREAPQIGLGRVAASHRAQHTVVAGLERDVQMTRNIRSLAKRGHKSVVDVVDLDRRETQTVELRRLARLTDELRERVAGRAVAEATE